jgi:hypothetical protein
LRCCIMDPTDMKCRIAPGRLSETSLVGSDSARARGRHETRIQSAPLGEWTHANRMRLPLEQACSG